MISGCGVFQNLSVTVHGAGIYVEFVSLFPYSSIQCIKTAMYGNSLVVQWLGLSASTATGLGSISGWGAKIPQAVRHGQKFKQTKKRQCKYWRKVAFQLMVHFGLPKLIHHHLMLWMKEMESQKSWGLLKVTHCHAPGLGLDLGLPVPPQSGSPSDTVQNTLVHCPFMKHSFNAGGLKTRRPR